ncbi:MAG: hypothetical protein HRU51_07780 [Xanthomonadales bacterium]|nr:hypothetical protein [Xanthomonadales bacterium]
MQDDSYFEADLLQTSDIEPLTSMVGAHFIRKEPLAHALGITQPEMTGFLTALLRESVRLQTGLVLRLKPEYCPDRSNNRVGYMIGTAYDYELPEAVARELSPKILSVFTLLEQLAASSPIETQPEETLIIQMLGVTFEFISGLSREDQQRFGASFKPVWLPAMGKLIRNHPRFNGVVGQTTGSNSRAYAENAGWRKVGYLPYADYVCPILQDRVFRTVPDGCTQFLLRVRD